MNRIASKYSVLKELYSNLDNYIAENEKMRTKCETVKNRIDLQSFHLPNLFNNSSIISLSKYFKDTISIYYNVLFHFKLVQNY